MKKVFMSYHFTSKNGKINGFGNWLGEFSEDAYENDAAKFILDSQEEIENLLKEKLGMEVGVKILFFR